MKQSTAVVGRRTFGFEQFCNYMITNSLLYAIDWLADRPLHMERLTPSQAAGGRALLRVMLWCSVAAAAAAAVLALRRRQLAGPGRRWILLALAEAALAFTAATHAIKLWLIFFHVPISPRESSRLDLLVAVGGIVVITAADIFLFVVLRRGDGLEEEKE